MMAFGNVDPGASTVSSHSLHLAGTFAVRLPGQPSVAVTAAVRRRVHVDHGQRMQAQTQRHQRHVQSLRFLAEGDPCSLDASHQPRIWLGVDVYEQLHVLQRL